MNTPITLHGWTVTVQPADHGVILASTEIPYKEGEEIPHYVNATGTSRMSALFCLCNRLQAAANVMLYLNDLEDGTYEKVSEFALHIQEEAWKQERLAA